MRHETLQARIARTQTLPIGNTAILVIGVLKDIIYNQMHAGGVPLDHFHSYVMANTEERFQFQVKQLNISSVMAGRPRITIIISDHMNDLVAHDAHT